MNDKTTFRCECETPERGRYIVTSHEGEACAVLYCDGCAELARIDWTGETASVVSEPAR